MNIEEEREAFEAVSPFSIYMNKVKRDGSKYTPIHYKYLDYARIMSFGWSAWQAKAQAVPGGFVLVPKEPSRKSILLGLKILQETDDIEKVFVAMIEAQEQPK